MLNNSSVLGTNSTEEVTELFMEEVVGNWMWTILSPIIFVTGVTGNCLNIAVIRKLGIQRQPTLIYISFLAITDTVVLVTGLPRYWILYVFDYDLRTIGNVGCKFFLFVVYLSMQYSSWILVSVTAERVIKTYFPLRYRGWYTEKRTVFSLFLTLFLLCIVDMHFFWTNGTDAYPDGGCGSLTAEDFKFDEEKFVFIDFAFLSAIPFTIMLILNIFIVRALQKIQVRRASMMHGSIWARTQRVSVKMTKMLVVCTVYFLFATVPISVYFIVDTYYTPKLEARGDNSSIARMDLAWTVSYLFQFTNYAANFFLYTFINDRFQRELKALFRCQSRRERKRQSVYSVNGGIRRRHNSREEDHTSVGLESSPHSSEDSAVYTHNSSNASANSTRSFPVESEV